MADIRDEKSLPKAAAALNLSVALPGAAASSGSTAALSPPAVFSPTAGNCPPPMSVFIWDTAEPGRVTIFPLRYPEIYEYRKHLEKLRWSVEDADLSGDAEDWRARMSSADRRAIRYALGLFAVFDTLVLDHLPKIADAVDCMEARRVYETQADQEGVHEEAYMLQIEAVTTDEADRQFMRDSIKNMPGVRALVQWARARLAVEDVRLRLAAMAVIEGVIFSAFFSILQWLRERNLLTGVVTFNELIVRDEGRHAMFSCLLIRKFLRVPLEKSAVVEILKSGVAVVSAMIDEAIPAPLAGINAAQVKKYVQFRGDAILRLMGFGAHYNTPNPLKFMDKLDLNAVAKVNFFERRVTQYQGAAAGDSEYRINDAPM